jgi:hypothetical protein
MQMPTYRIYVYLGKIDNPEAKDYQATLEIGLSNTNIILKNSAVKLDLNANCHARFTRCRLSSAGKNT